METVNQSRYLTVLDFFTGRIWQYDQSYLEGWEHVEDFLVEMGFSLSNIEYMVSTNPSAVFNRKYNKNL